MVRNKQQKYRYCWELKLIEDIEVVLVCWNWKLPYSDTESGMITRNKISRYYLWCYIKQLYNINQDKLIEI